jgi:hypothetical protein
MTHDNVSKNKSSATTIRVELDESKIIRKVTNDRFGLLVSKTWRDLIDPYVPYRTGSLAGVTDQTVTTDPWEIWYRMTYAEYVYFSNKWKFSKEMHPSATDHWDKAAEQAGKKEDLYRTLNSALQNGLY